MHRSASARTTAGALLRAFFSIALSLGMLPTALFAEEQPDRRAILLSVDATDAPRRILHARLVIPAKPGPFTLVYPKWIPGEHGPTGPIIDLAGLKLTAADKQLSWSRDDADMYAFSCHVPAEVDVLTVNLDFLAAPASAGRFSAGASCSAKLAVVSWNQFVLYPRGTSLREVEFRADLTVPAGWKVASSLPVENRSAERTTFTQVSLETLIDSPVLCGAYMKDITIGSSNGPAHRLHVAADSPEAIRLEPSLIAKFDNLVAEAGALFGSRPYGSYHFLLALSDHVAHFGLEHHQSSDNRVPERLLLDDTLMLAYADLLPHEYIHSWNGKYRRPRDMITRDYQEPQKTRLLWVYEGLTDYLDMVLAARSGLCSADDFNDSLALYAQYVRNMRGRAWRPLDDTAAAFQTFDGDCSDWAAWRRAAWDVYDEGAMIWLEADCLIRGESKGRRSLDDFCRRFFGGANGTPSVKPYVLDDVIADLNAVVPYDWAGFFRQRTAEATNAAPLRGIELGGWRLAYGDAPSSLQQAWDAQWSGATDLSASIGLSVKDDGAVVDVIPGGPADRAGVAPGMNVLGVNMRRFTTDRLCSAIAAARDGQAPLELLVENADYLRVCELDYPEGEKYPRLERNQTKPDLLGEIIKPIGGRTPTGDKDED